MSDIAPVGLNDTIALMSTHQTVLDVFMARAKAAPERVCVRFGDDLLYARFPGVREVAVIGLPDAEYREQLVAAIAAGGTDQDAVIAFCKDQLASYKKPKRVLFVDALPRNAMQKVQKNLVKELFLH